MTARERRAIARGVGVMALAILVLRVVPRCVRGLSATRVRAAQQAQLAADTRELISRSAVVRESLDIALKAVVSQAPSLIEGRTPAEAAATLQSLLNGRATTSRMRVTRFDVSEDSTGAPVRQLRARIELEGDIRGLVALLESVETGTPLLTVDAMSVIVPDPTPRPGIPETLRVSLGVIGWFFVGRTA